MEMLWWPLYVLCGSFILAFSEVLSLDEYSTVAYDPDDKYSTVAYDPDDRYSTVAFDPNDDSTFIRNVAFMFPKNFLSRFPQEADSYRLKIFVYLFFNLLVKGYGSLDPVTIWMNYNRDNYKRALIDAVFYEYLTNYTDRGYKDLLFNPLENTGGNISNLLSNEEIAVDRIGQYLDLLSEDESGPEMIKGAYEILSETNEDTTVAEDQTTECNGPHQIQTFGIPGKDYPNFCDIPETSFTCEGKRIPGIYSDYETGCQAFHVCWLNRQDSFLCPIGTIFNHSLLACDIWHDTGCYSSRLLNYQRNHLLTMKDVPNYDGSCQSILTEPLKENIKFLPAKCEVKDVFQKKVKPRGKDLGEIKARLDAAYNKIIGLLQVLRKRELENCETSRIHIVAKNSKTIPNRKTDTLEEATEFTRKLGESNLKQLKVAEQVVDSKTPESGLKLGHYVKSSTLLRPSKSLEEYMQGMQRKDVPEIVSRSPRLGSTILNEGVIPLAKQVMMDSYRKIESKMR